MRQSGRKIGNADALAAISILPPLSQKKNTSKPNHTLEITIKNPHGQNKNPVFDIGYADINKAGHYSACDSNVFPAVPIGKISVYKRANRVAEKEAYNNYVLLAGGKTENSCKFGNIIVNIESADVYHIVHQRKGDESCPLMQTVSVFHSVSLMCSVFEFTVFTFLHMQFIIIL